MKKAHIIVGPFDSFLVHDAALICDHKGRLYLRALM